MTTLAKQKREASRPRRAEAARWRAVCARATPKRDQFFYAVRTTGIFCRAGCASRRPNRENVEFFTHARDALARGYRPCRRCHPLGKTPARGAAIDWARACQLLSADDAPGPSNRVIARQLGVSPAYFQRRFAALLGITPQQFRRRVLAERAKQRLSKGKSITQAALESGYGSLNRFYQGAARELGMPPRVARRGGSGVAVRYVTRRCSLGVILIAWTDRGACDVRFGGSQRETAAGLRERFPAAQIARTATPAWVDRLVKAVERPTLVDVPLDARGTAFQERVWQELRRIPPGKTRTYTEVAQAIGRPRAVRAVAHACASNPVAVAIPCHRVVRGTGHLAGYRWGLERKRALLEREGVR